MPAVHTQLGRGDRRLDAEAVQVLEIIAGHVPGVDAVRCGQDLEVIGRPRHHPFLAVEGILGPHADEADIFRVPRVVCSFVSRDCRTSSKAKVSRIKWS